MVSDRLAGRPPGSRRAQEPARGALGATLPGVRAVLLDALGTLVRLEPPAPRLRAELARRGIEVSNEQASAAFRAEIDFYLAHHLEGSSAAGLDRLRDGCARVIAGVLGRGPAEIAAIREAMLGALRFSAYPDAAPAVRALRGAGLSLVVGSNWDCSLPRVLEAVGLRSLVRGVVTSAEVGAPKPRPELFQAALDAADCPPEHAVWIGDSLELDVLGARAAGIEAVLLAREGTPPAIPEGVAVVRSLAEARSLILPGG